MADKAGEGAALLQSPVVIVSETKVDYREMFALNRTVVDLILRSDADLLTKVGLLGRILPSLMDAGSCACSCSCSCSCSCTCGREATQAALTPQAGRV